MLGRQSFRALAYRVDPVRLRPALLPCRARPSHLQGRKGYTAMKCKRVVRWAVILVAWASLPAHAGEATSPLRTNRQDLEATGELYRRSFDEAHEAGVLVCDAALMRSRAPRDSFVGAQALGDGPSEGSFVCNANCWQNCTAGCEQQRSTCQSSCFYGHTNCCNHCQNGCPYGFPEVGGPCAARCGESADFCYDGCDNDYDNCASVCEVQCCYVIY